MPLATQVFSGLNFAACSLMIFEINNWFAPYEILARADALAIPDLVRVPPAKPLATHGRSLAAASASGRIWQPKSGGGLP
jgi:hypothetical protein